MEKKRRIFKMEIDDADESPVFAMSLVENPAIEVDFVALSKQSKLPVKLAVSNNDKRELVGLALVPEMRIPRIDPESNDEYDIYFSQDTVAKAAHKFLSSGLTKSITLEHSEDAEGKASIVESWLVEDAVLDKSQKYGLNAPVGSWAIKMKVYDDLLWQDVKLGKVRGFSLEGAFKHVAQDPDNIEMSAVQKDTRTDAEKQIDLIRQLLIDAADKL